MNGFLLIDKPQGINSFKLVMALRKLTGQRRVGFAGTLDPLASGLMVLALGEYTKLLSYLEARDKVYVVDILLGKVSDTYDTDGQVQDGTAAAGARPVSREVIDALLVEYFVGEISQTPPRFSAVQIAGKRAYDLARKGVDFQLASRQVQIFSCRILDYDFPNLRLEVHCSSGTYVRSLAHDLGEKLGCGGVVAGLRRLKVGDLSVEDAVSLEQMPAEGVDKFLLSPRRIFENIFKPEQMIEVNQSEYAVLARGNFIDNTFGLAVDAAASQGLAFFEGQLVGVVETIENGQKLKFKKKLHIF